MKIDGACQCGKVTYEAEIDPERIFICHCTDCQTMSGGPYRALAPTKEGAFRLLSGAVKIYAKTGSSGAKRALAFCPECGSAIYGSAMEESPKVHNIRVGCIRQRDRLVPKKQIWARSKQVWIDELTSIPGLEKQ